MDDILILKQPHRMNQQPIEFDNEKLYFYQGQYNDGTTAVYCETESGYSYEIVSVDVSDHVGKYGLKYNEIVLNHNLNHEFKELFFNEFCSNIEQDYWECKEIQYGFSCSNIVEIYPSLLVKTYTGIIVDV